MEYALKRTAPGVFDEVAEAVERSIDEHGFVVVGAHDVHVTLAAKGFRIHPVRIYELRDTCDPEAGAVRAFGLLAREIVPVRISVFVEHDVVVVAAIRPGVISDMFPEAGLEEAATEIEGRVVAIVNEVADRGV